MGRALWDSGIAQRVEHYGIVNMGIYSSSQNKSLTASWSDYTDTLMVFHVNP